MPFQFYCPQGHLLEGHESQAGQQSQCPLCGAMFLIPGPVSTYGQPPGMMQSDPGVYGGGSMAPAPAPQIEPQSPPAEQPAAPAAETKPEEPAKLPEPSLFRIACPQGHVLETPSDIIGQQALCPYCNTQFELRYEDSEEYAAEMVEARIRREQQINEAWVKWSIRLAVLVGVMFVAMIGYMLYS